MFSGFSKRNRIPARSKIDKRREESPLRNVFPRAFFCSFFHAFFPQPVRHPPPYVYNKAVRLSPRSQSPFSLRNSLSLLISSSSAMLIAERPDASVRPLPAASSSPFLSTASREAVEALDAVAPAGEREALFSALR